MKINPRKTISGLLTAFVLISIGFALGRETARYAGEGRTSTRPASQTADQDKVIVYYMHTTFRCVTCNKIESLTDSIVRSDFAADLAAGRIEWKSVNFQESGDLAARYGVGTSCVVVAKVRGGREVAFKRLDEVWTKVHDPEAFGRYVAGAIRDMRGGGGE